MSRSSDWINLFVNQGKEFIDSVSRQKWREGLPPKSNEQLTAVSHSSTDLENMSQTASSNGTGNSEARDGAFDVSTKGRVLVAETDSPSSAKTTITKGQKEIYENQLEQLQEQLVDIMIKNQEMGMLIDTIGLCNSNVKCNAVASETNLGTKLFQQIPPSQHLFHYKLNIKNHQSFVLIISYL